MAKHTIAWLPGDGVGNDIMTATRIVLDTLNLDAEYIPADIGWEFWVNEGNPLPDRTIDILNTTDCALLGAVTSKPRDEANLELIPSLQGTGLSYFSPIVKLRQLFNLHTNLRPCKAYPGNPLNRLGDDIDLVVFRESTEGSSGGVEWFPLPHSVATAMADPADGLPEPMENWFDTGLDNVALSTRIMSTQGCERICNKAFEFADEFSRNSVTLVENPGVLYETGGLMTRAFREVAAGHPRIDPWEVGIDALCTLMIKNPQEYDVLVAENMFGEIVSDLCAGLVGGLGFVPGANLGDSYALFEPAHGSIPEHAGDDVVNPIAMILAARMMLE